jgi:hypothetical protein
VADRAEVTGWEGVADGARGSPLEGVADGVGVVCREGVDGWVVAGVVPERDEVEGAAWGTGMARSWMTPEGASVAFW